MLYGALLVIGIIGVIASRFMYGFYDITLGGDEENNLKGGLALFLDIISTAIVVYSIINSI